MNVTSKVGAHYDQNAQQEWERLEEHRTEFAVTLRVLEDFLPPAPARVLDVGGGPGRYAVALSGLGYRVTLADLSKGSLELAKEKAAEAGVSLEAFVHADALDLSSFEPAAFDALLLMGPLYHLLRESERRQAVREARRVLKPGGRIFAAFISRFAPFRWCAAFDPGWYLTRKAYTLSVLETGVHDQGEEFPNAYFAHPREIAPLMEGCGFGTLTVVGCEGAVSLHEEQVNALQGSDWQDWVELNYRLGKDPHSHGAAEHLLYVGENLPGATPHGKSEAGG